MHKMQRNLTSSELLFLREISAAGGVTKKELFSLGMKPSLLNKLEECGILTSSKNGNKLMVNDDFFQ